MGTQQQVTVTPPKKVQVSVSVGITTVIGWLTAIGGAIPIVVKLLEEGQKGLTLSGPEKWAAIIGVVALGVTQFGRYIQSVVVAQHAAQATYPNPATQYAQGQPTPVATLPVVPGAVEANGSPSPVTTAAGQSS